MRRRLRWLPALAVVLLALGLVPLLAPSPPPPPAVVRYSPARAAQAESRIEAAGRLLEPPAPADAPPPAASAPAAPAPETAPEAPPATPKTPPPAPPSGPRPVRISLSEEDLNTYLATNPAARSTLKSYGVDRVQMILQKPNRVILRVALIYNGRHADMEIQGRLRTDREAGVALVAGHVQVDRVVVPPSVITTRFHTLLAGVVRRPGRPRFDVQRVQVRDGSLVLSGLIEPRRPEPRQPV